MAGNYILTQFSEVDTSSILLPNGGTLLNWYEEFTSSGNQWTGIWAANVSGEYSIGRIGKMVCLKIPFVTAVATVGGTITNTILLPAQFRPSLTITGVIVIIDNATQNIASYSIDNTGLITITAAPNGTTFSGAGLSGIPLTYCLSYMI